MTRLPMSRAAAALLRALLLRAPAFGDRILLSAVRSVDWHSLTFTGERHQMLFHVTGPIADQVCAILTDGIEEAEFSLPGLIVADIHAERRNGGTQSFLVAIEALTVVE